jgi:hypothetical protein
MWHPRIHRRWADEELTFWRFAFFPAYRKEHVVADIRAAMQKHGVGSYVIYETLGVFDLLLSAWLPARATGRFEESLAELLDDEYLQLMEPFPVSRLLRHWAWDDDDGGLSEPSAATLEQRWDAGLISRANRGELTPDERRMFDEEHVLTQLTPPSEGIRFIIVVSSAVYSLTAGVRERLRAHLVKLAQKPSIKEAALFEGSGFGQYVLTGAIDATEFDVIRVLSSELNELAEELPLTARPYTNICVDLVDYADTLRVDVEDNDGDSVRALLVSSDAHRVAVQGSVRLDWHAWLQQEGGDLPLDERNLDDGLIRTVVGMLNADGGQVVVGALAGEASVAGELVRDHPKLEGYPRVGKFVCVGVNLESAEKGWDGFQLELRDWLATKIDPTPTNACTVSRRTLDGVDMCVIGVEPRESIWYYRFLGPTEPVRFFVRTDGRTVAYAGSTADAYKRTRPRG